jgi:hypothetical protein
MYMAVFWVVAPRSLIIALMMEVADTSETSVNFYQTTRCNIPEDNHLHSQFTFFSLDRRPSVTPRKPNDSVFWYLQQLKYGCSTEVRLSA